MPKGHVIACSHGAGPLVLLGVDHQQPLVPVLEEQKWMLDGAKGIIVVTAHWQAENPTISAAAQHDLLFDYPKSLPKEAFQVTYPAPGGPELARKAAEALIKGGFEPQLDFTRGWDHGVFVPMIYLRPQADIPIVQMSILHGHNTDQHIRMGRALMPLRNEGYAIVGSGSSFHNLKDVMSSMRSQLPLPLSNLEFEARLEEAMISQDEDVRLEKLRQWNSFHGADYVHPPKHEEHFMPFLVAAGASGSDKTVKGQTWNLFGANFSTYSW